MSYVVLRYTGHPAFFRHSLEMLKRWNPQCAVQHPVNGVALVFGVGGIEQLKEAAKDWAFDPGVAAELAQKLGLDSDSYEN